jgi:hypothetical protein
VTLLSSPLLPRKGEESDANALLHCDDQQIFLREDSSLFPLFILVPLLFCLHSLYNLLCWVLVSPRTPPETEAGSTLSPFSRLDSGPSSHLPKADEKAKAF